MTDTELARAMEVIRDRLYYVVVRVVPAERSDAHFFTVDGVLHYYPFFLDYGPLSLGCLYRFSQILSSKLTDRALAGKRIYMFSSPHQAQRANAVYLLAAYCLLFLGRTPEEALRPFARISPPITPWHDASQVRAARPPARLPRPLRVALRHQQLQLAPRSLLPLPPMPRLIIPLPASSSPALLLYCPPDTIASSPDRRRSTRST